MTTYLDADAPADSGGPATIDLADEALWTDPYPLLHAARAQHPVALTPTGQPILLRFDDAEAVLKDRRFESHNLHLLTGNGIVDGPVFEWFRRIMLNANGERHAHLRSLVTKAFTPRSIERLRPDIRRATHAILDRHPDGEIDFVADFADQIPIQVMCGFFGVPADDYRELAAWSTEALLVLSAVVTPEQRAASDAAMTRLFRYVTALVEQRRRTPGDDMVTALVHAEERGIRLDEDDLLTMIVNMIVGGHDTSASMLAIGLSLFATHPEQQHLLRNDPTMMAAAAEEVLRAESPTNWVGRVPLTDVEVAGVTLRGGEYVLVSALAANHDPAVFPEPDVFDITRAGERMLAFGYGPHYCLGAALARVEAQEVFATVMARCRDIALLEPPEWIPFLSVRHIRRLPARFEPG